MPQRIVVGLTVGACMLAVTGTAQAKQKTGFCRDTRRTPRR
jgi:hypothetical protein